MSSELSLRRRKPARALISLVPMIDVMLILLVFFMVTSTYLNLDMIPALSRTEAPSQGTSGAETSAPLLIRVGADGAPYFRGRALAAEELSQLLLDQIEQDPSVKVIILPTGSANIQALVTVMDLITRTGITNMRVVRLEGAP